MKRPIKVIFFDLGNTLIYDKPKSWLNVYQRADDSLWVLLREYGIKSSPSELYGEHETLLHYYYNLREGDLDEPGISSVLRELLNKHKITLSEKKLQSALRSMYAVTQTNWHIESDAVPVLLALQEIGPILNLSSHQLRLVNVNPIRASSAPRSTILKYPLSKPLWSAIITKQMSLGHISLE